MLVALSISGSAKETPKTLFNGKNLDGWQQVGPGSFVVKDGMMKTEGGMGMLWILRKDWACQTPRGL